MNSINNYIELKNAFRKTSILVIGDIILDLYIDGSTSRISPEAPIPVVKVENKRMVLGGASNVANNLSSLGAKAFLAGVIGNDEEGSFLKKLLKEKKINAQALVQDKRPTTVKTRILCNQQQMLRLDKEVVTPLNPQAEAKFINALKTLIQKNSFGAIIISDYAKGVVNPQLVQKVILFAKSKKIPVIVDPKNHDFTMYKGASYIKPNLQEAALAANSPKLNGADVSEIEKAGAILLKKAQAKGILISRNKYGMSLIKKKSNHHVNSKATEVSDVSGAGDTVLSVFALGIATGLTAEFSAEIANIAAGIVVQKHGTATVTPEEIIKSLDISHQKQALPRNELKNFLDVEKKLGNKIVFTNGCFDLLHVGHVKLLEEARKQGNILVVAINSDKSVKKLKGDGRPLINEEDRAKLLLSLGCVDYVVIFDEATPCNLLKLLKPDILVKGGDYKYHEVVGWEIVEAYGGQVTTIDLVKGKSTTKTLQQILKKNLSLKELGLS